MNTKDEKELYLEKEIKIQEINDRVRMQMDEKDYLHLESEKKFEKERNHNEKEWENIQIQILDARRYSTPDNLYEAERDFIKSKSEMERKQADLKQRRREARMLFDSSKHDILNRRKQEILKVEIAYKEALIELKNKREEEKKRLMEEEKIDESKMTRFERFVYHLRQQVYKDIGYVENV